MAKKTNIQSDFSAFTIIFQNKSGPASAAHYK